VLTWNNKSIKAHIDRLLSIPGAKLLFGGKELTNHTIPSIYGSYEPTAIFVPLDQILDAKHFEVATKELFGPFQVVTEYTDVTKVLDVINSLKHHLTAGVVSNDTNFIRSVTANTVNGVTYT
jgi:1-pyrroline-5-carboxylate dehydrogenase